MELITELALWTTPLFFSLQTCNISQSCLTTGNSGEGLLSSNYRAFPEWGPALGTYFFYQHFTFVVLASFRNISVG